MNCWQYPECGLHSVYLESFLGTVTILVAKKVQQMAEENV